MKDPAKRSDRAGQSDRKMRINYTAPIERLLPHLDKVKQIAPDRWTACCPAHDDKHPSLGIRETDDGTILLKCWSGCTAQDIINAVGLELRDLFPQTNRRPGLRPLTSRADREKRDHAYWVVGLFEADRQLQKPLTAADRASFDNAMATLREHKRRFGHA